MRGFYAIIDRPDLSLIQLLLAAKPCALQVRKKPASGEELLTIAKLALPLCKNADVPLIINDRLDIAIAIGASGVHLGQEDIPVADARAFLRGRNAEMLIGLSTHNLDQVIAANELDVDYIGFGPVRHTGTKHNPDPTVGFEQLAEACRISSVPVVAIGGITPADASQLAAAGASAACAISSVLAAQDPTFAGAAIRDALG